jgi:hypothetical protein
MEINRFVVQRSVPCGRKKDVVVPLAEGLQQMAETPCAHPRCCCTFDPLDEMAIAEMHPLRRRQLRAIGIDTGATDG